MSPCAFFSTENPRGTVLISPKQLLNIIHRREFRNSEFRKKTKTNKRNRNLHDENNMILTQTGFHRKKCSKRVHIKTRQTCNSFSLLSFQEDCLLFFALFYYSLLYLKGGYATPVTPPPLPCRSANEISCV